MVDADEQFYALEAAEPQVTIEVRRATDGADRIVAAQFSKQVACDVEDLGFKTGAVDLAGGEGHGCRSARVDLTCIESKVWVQRLGYHGGVDSSI